MDSHFAEQALLTCLLNDGAVSSEIDLDPSEFENAQYSLIYRSILAVINSDEAMDAITVAVHMEHSTSKNWMPILTEIAQGSGATENAKSYAKMIRKAHRARQASLIGARLMQMSNEPDAVDNAIRALMEIGKEQSNFEYDLKDVIKLAVAEVERAFNNKGELVGISTGIADLDYALGGFHPGDLCIVGARPAIGKTAVMLNFMMAANAYIACCSGEQGVVQVGQRILSMTSRVSLMNMRNGRLNETEWPRLVSGANITMKHPGIKFYDKPGPSITDIESQARRWKYEYGIKALYVDYLQRIKREKGVPKNEAVGENAQRLKELARELEIPVISLAQVNRECEKRPDKRPMVGDLADSSEIEKEADLIMLLYRDEVYNPDTLDKGIMEVNIGKARSGATGMVSTQWDGRFLKIGDLSKYDGVER